MENLFWIFVSIGTIVAFCSVVCWIGSYCNCKIDSAESGVPWYGEAENEIEETIEAAAALEAEKTIFAPIAKAKVYNKKIGR